MLKHNLSRSSLNLKPTCPQNEHTPRVSVCLDRIASTSSSLSLVDAICRTQPTHTIGLCVVCTSKWNAVTVSSANIYLSTNLLLSNWIFRSSKIIFKLPVFALEQFSFLTDCRSVYRISMVSFDTNLLIFLASKEINCNIVSVCHFKYIARTASTSLS